MKTNTFKFNRVSIASIFLLLFCLAGSRSLYAQGVGINLTGQSANASAVLDLNTGNGGKYGFLPPQVALTASNVAAPVTAPATGLIVFNTATAGTAPNNVTVGFYYWNGSSWSRLNDNNPNIPYGYNTQYANGSTAADISTSSTTFALMTGMSITFTPVHSTVFLTFKAACFAAPSTQESGVVEVLKGATVVGGATCIVGNYNASTDLQAGIFNIFMPISGLTPGTAVTISIDWRSVGGNAVENYTKTYPTAAYRTMFIND